MSTQMIRRLWPRASELWPAWIGPLVIAFVYLAQARDWEVVLRKSVLESIALVLTPIALFLFARTALQTRDALAQLLTALSLVFFLREIHFRGTSTGAYVGLVLIAVWAWRWRERLLPTLELGGTRRWLYSALLTYLLSQLVARRVFSFLPDEQGIHIPAEEMLENAAHTLWIATAMVSRRSLLKWHAAPVPSLVPENEARTGSAEAR